MTLAPEVEPYTSGVTGLSGVAYAAAWNLLVLGDRDLNGDRPWQAKRFAVRRAYEAGAERVAWSDSDIEIVNPVYVAGTLNQSGRSGIWTAGELSIDGYFESMSARNPKRPDLVSAARSLYLSMVREFAHGAPALHFHDWFVVYVIPPETALRVLDIWDRIAERLLCEGLTWSDGLSLGIAAAACGVPIRDSLRTRRFRRGIRHLLWSNRNGLYATKGECSP